MIPLLYIFSDWGILILRVFLGGILARRGFPKVKNLKSLKTGEKVFAFSEFLGGLMILFGVLTQIATLVLTLEFLVIILKAKRKQEKNDGRELNWLILASLIILMTLGSGIYSADNFLRFLIY